MAVAEELAILIRAETAKAVREMRKAQQGADKTEQSFAKLAQRLTRNIGVTAAAALSFRALYRQMQQNIRAYAEQEQAERSLEQAIIATGREAEISAESIKKLAAELQQTTIYGDEATISAAAMTQQLANLSEGQLRQIIPQIQNFASAMGMDLNTAARLVGQTIGGTTNTLGRYGVQIDNSLEGSDRFSAVLTQLTGRFDGMAEAIGSTATASLAQFNNALSDLREEMGAGAMGLFEPIVRGSTRFVEEITNAAAAARALRDVLADREAVTASTELERAIEGQQSVINDIVSNLSRQGRETSRQLELEREKLASLQQQLETARQREALDAQFRRGIDEGFRRQLRLQQEFEDAVQQRIALQQREADEIANIDRLQAEGILTAEQAATRKQETLREIRRDALQVVDAFDAIAREAAVAFRDPGKLTQVISTDQIAQFIAELNAKLQPEILAAAGDSMTRSAEEIAKGIMDPIRSEMELAFRQEQFLIQWESDLADAADRAAEKKRQAFQYAFSTIGGMALQTFGMLNNLMRQNTQNSIREINKQLKAISARYELEIAWAKAAGASEQELDELRAQQLEEQQAAEEAADKKKSQLAKDQFRRDQALQTGQAIMSTATAVMQAYAQLGPIGGHIAAGLISTMGLAQLGIIQAQQPPAFERGGSFVTNGPQMIQVGDGQSPRERVTVEPLSGPYRKGGGDGITIIINGAIGGREEVARWVHEGIRKGQQRGALR